MGQEIKICGLSTRETLETALSAGADLVGFVHYPASPRHVSLEEAPALSSQAKGRALRTVLLVDPTDGEIEAVVSAFDPDLLQLHGKESPERVAAIQRRTGLPVMKAIGISAASDLAAISAYAEVADRLLLDAKAPPEAALPGGNGRPFDWGLLSGFESRRAFMLSGGLSHNNVAAAIAATGAGAVDVSSGVESRPGEKDPARIRAFIAAARAAFKAGARAKEPVA